MIEFRVLGGVEVDVDGRPVDVGPAKQRCVLAVLLVEANTAVAVDQLIDRVWRDHPPLRARSSLHTYATRLRRALGSSPVSITGRSGTYTLAVDEQTIDLHRFRHVVTAARATADDEQALALLEQAVGLWRGEPFAGLDVPWLADLRVALERERGAARLAYNDLALRCGRHAELLPELSTMATTDPLDERVAGQLMLALYHSGRQAEALAGYHQIRSRLADELGVDPCPRLKELHQQILATDPALAVPASAMSGSGFTTQPVPAQLPADIVTFTGHAETTRGSAGAESSVVPRQLPAAPWAFTGRIAHLAALTAALGHQGTVVISAIGGAGGIGKTWLALAWAHRHLDQFPDGQLFVDLRGFSPDSAPMAPAVAMRGFLEALGVAPGRIPVDPQAQTGLLRSLVAHKRMLIVLDNAADADQVVPLLPGGEACTVVVTSRRTLTGLITRHGAQHLALDTLSDDESRALLTRRLGAARVATEPEAMEQLVRLCGGLPLALGIIAGRAANDPHLPLKHTVTDLREFGLDALDSDDPAASLPTVLSWSVRRLTARQRTVFALLGIAPGPNVGLPAAANLTDLPAREARDALHGLVDASLLDRTDDDRYVMHDLIRAYASTRAHHNLPEPLRMAALERVMDFYLHTAHTAHCLLNTLPPVIRPEPPAPGVRPQPLPNQTAAMIWLEAEYPNLLAAQHAAATHHHYNTTWHLALNLTTFHRRRGHIHNELAVWRAALDVAAHLTDPTTHIHTHRFIGRAHCRLGGHEQATGHLRQALALAEHHHDTTQQAHIHHELAVAWERRGDDRMALNHSRHALDLYRTLDNPVREAEALNAVGWYAARLGEYNTGRDYCQAALTLTRHHHDPDGEANTLDSLGYIAHHTGNHHQAIQNYHQALTLFRALGYAYWAANTLDNMGHPHAALGRHDQARTVWHEALMLFRDQGRAEDADRIQHQLDALDQPDTDQTGHGDSN